MCIVNHQIEHQQTLKPKRCIDPVMKYCQGCKYGYVIYPDYVETYEDTFNCSFKTGCIYGLENTEPTENELEEFRRWVMKGSEV